MTSDHGNANPASTARVVNYTDSDAAFARLVAARASYGVLRSRLLEQRSASGQVSPDVVRAGIEAWLGIQVSAEHARASRTRCRQYQGLSRQLSNVDGTLGQVLGNHTGIGWTGTSHTADLAPVLALGPGQHRFDGLRRNVDVFTTLVELMGQSFRNPEVTPEQARALKRVASVETIPPHWV